MNGQCSVCKEENANDLQWKCRRKSEVGVMLGIKELKVLEVFSFRKEDKKSALIILEMSNKKRKIRISLKGRKECVKLKINGNLIKKILNNVKRREDRCETKL